jgi:hypothetical protein
MQGLACLTLFGCPVAMIAPQLAASSAEASLLEPARAAASVDPVAPSADAPAPLLDLAWIAPRPSDLPGAGYGLIERSGWTTAADQFDWMLDDKPQQAALFADVTANMGWRQAWSGSRATPLPDAPDLYARRLHVELTQTETAAGAHDLSRGLALFALPSIGFVPASPIPGSAPGVVRFRADGVFPDGTSYHLASMLVPDGDVVMFFTLTDFTGDIPAFSEVAMLVAPVQARLAKARAGEPTGLAMQVPRYGWEGMPSPDLDYLMVDGAVQQPFGATAAEVESIEIQLVIDEAREMIRGWTPLPASRQTTASLGVWQTLVRFSNVDAADSFIDRGADDLLEGYLPGTAQMDLVMDLPSGDRAVLVTYLTSEGPNQPWWQAADLWVRVGTRVAWTGVIAPADLPRADLERLARQAAKCLETGDCAEFQPLPASLLVDPAPVIRPPADRLQPTA